MRLYHGSNVIVEHPTIMVPKRLLDFGPGFYLTSSLEQASRWASRTARRHGMGEPVVTVFDLDEACASELSWLRFDGPDSRWLRYITRNRTDASYTDTYDLVSGPVANDQAIRTLNNFLDGYLTEEMALQLLLPQRLKDQYAMKTASALSALTFVEVIHP